MGVVKLVKTKNQRRLHIGSFFTDLNESEYQELEKIFGKPENISKEELVRLSKLKELYVKYTNEGVTDSEMEVLRQVAYELAFCFAVDTKI